MNIKNWIEESSKEFTDLSDKLWNYAELKFEENKSVKDILKILLKYEFKITKGIENMDTAFIAEYGDGKPIIGILAEYDALDGMSQQADSIVRIPRNETTCGHGCGHNAFGGGSVAAAVALKEYLKATGTKGTIRLLGCPGEEGGSGKTFMARAGVFNDLDTAIAWHPASVNGVFSASTLANIQVYYNFKGRSSHAASSPHLGRSALDSVELMNVGVNYLREHIISDAKVHYAVTNTGGISPNVVQSEAEVLYLIRAPKTSQVLEIYDRINDIARGAALMSGTEVEIKIDKACSNFIPIDILNEKISSIGQNLPQIMFTDEEKQYAKKFIDTFTESEKKSNMSMLNLIAKRKDRKKLIKIMNEPLITMFMPFIPTDNDIVIPGSTDVGDVSWITPTVQCTTTCYAQGTPAHSWQMVAQGKSSITHKGLIRAGVIMALMGEYLFNNTDIIDKAKEELSERLCGEEYICPIPKEINPKPYKK